MTTYDLLQLFNAIFSGSIAIRLMTFTRGGAAHKPVAAWLAYAVIVICGTVPIRLIYGWYIGADWSDVILKAIFCAAVFKTRGNVMQLFKISRSS